MDTEQTLPDAQPSPEPVAAQSPELEAKLGDPPSAEARPLPRVAPEHVVHPDSVVQDSNAEQLEAMVPSSNKSSLSSSLANPAVAPVAADAAIDALEHPQSSPDKTPPPVLPALPADPSPTSTQVELPTVDIDALLSNIGASLLPAAVPEPASALESAKQNPPASLPPRPPPHQDLNHHRNISNDIRSYHPHPQAQTGASAQHTYDTSALQPPTAAASSMTLPTAPGLPSRENFMAPPAKPSSGADDEDYTFPPELEASFDQFLRDEKANVAEGSWDRFPDGSRLFVGRCICHRVLRLHGIDLPAGNIPTEKVSKRDVFKRFAKYGKLAQIALKQAFGFVQFYDPESCAKALAGEQDKPLKGRKMRAYLSLILR